MDETLAIGRQAAEELATLVHKAGASSATWRIAAGSRLFFVVVECERAGKPLKAPDYSDIAPAADGARAWVRAEQVAAHLDMMGASATFWDLAQSDDVVLFVYVEAAADGGADSPRGVARALRFSADGNFKVYRGTD